MLLRCAACAQHERGASPEATPPATTAAATAAAGTAADARMVRSAWVGKYLQRFGGVGFRISKVHFLQPFDALF